MWLSLSSLSLSSTRSTIWDHTQLIRQICVKILEYEKKKGACEYLFDHIGLFDWLVDEPLSSSSSSSDVLLFRDGMQNEEKGTKIIILKKLDMFEWRHDLPRFQFIYY